MNMNREEVFIFDFRLNCSNVVEFWQCVSNDAELSGFIIDHFLSILSSSCLYEVPGENQSIDRQNIATHQPFAIFCALREILGGKQIQGVSPSSFNTKHLNKFKNSINK